jgi:acyl-CoA reductase-like NAD-dependent aldehyde dehydrogenase
LTTLRLGELAAPLLPPGVLNVIAGGNEIGRLMAEHPGIQKIAFTGSVATGKRVMASAAATLKRVTLELGGNDAAIVFDDVDPARVAPKLFAGAFVNAGQVCMAIKRLYVHERIYEPMCEALAAIARASKVGDGSTEGTQMGPLQNRAQYDIVRELIDDSRQSGGRVLSGGTREAGGGYFIEPVIVADVAEGTRLVDEEQFGPVLPVLRFSDTEDVIARANATDFGLGASVWSADLERAEAVAQRLEAGSVWINHHVGTDVQVPFGGAKQSGIGRQYSLEGLRGFMEVQALYAPAALD